MYIRNKSENIEIELSSEVYQYRISALNLHLQGNHDMAFNWQRFQGTKTGLEKKGQNL